MTHNKATLPPLATGDPQAFSKEFHGKSYGMVFRVPRLLKGTEPARENFSGYYLPYGSTQTVAALEAYYLHGQPSAYNKGLAPEELAEWRGYPVSGDGTTKAHSAGNFTMGDLPAHTPVVTPAGHLF